MYLETYSIIPFSKWLITMAIVFVPEDRVVGPLPNGLYKWLRNGNDPKHLLSGMILQVTWLALREGFGVCHLAFLRPCFL